MEDNLNTGSLWGEGGEQVAQTSSEQDVQSTNTQDNVQGTVSNVDHTEVSNKPTPQESFQEIRLKAERLQKERDEAHMTLRRIEEYAIQQQQQSQQQRQPEPEPDPDLDDDDYIEARHFKKTISSLTEQLNQFKQQQQSSSIEMQLKSRYSDFDKVMTRDNIAKLREMKPELAASLYKLKDIDPYNTAASTYSLLKEMGVDRQDSYEPERERAQSNFNKPQASSSLKKTESALSHASEFSGSRLTEDRKKEIWTTMQNNLRRS